MSRIGSAIVAGALLLCLVLHAAPASAHTHWKLTWSDEFNGADGAPPDPTKWSIVTGGRGFGNHELEQYTDRSENVHQERGHLVIMARKEAFTGTDGIAREYTSARLQTKGKFAQKYGRFEARIRIPKGQGMWPAFWLLGSDIDAAGWPACGEIDVMENVGFEPMKVHGTLHGPRYSGDSPLTGAYTLPRGAFSDDFHVYAVEWDEHEIRFFVDGHLYETQTTDSIPGNKRWVFDHPFYLLLNLAVGGDWPKSPDATTQFPQQMLVDYVRVYQPR
ncbi:family 16 glycosylhydrolase [Terriglobus sp. 2YAB30_2]|uniref:glycoside hydrolase family 16 protein n=1 Tax=unclassified Terriglobus TaxID=2628988 RepID=UPI003F97A389